jgi:hypothetical protein
MTFHRQPLRVKVGRLETPYHKMELKFAGLESLFEDELSAVVKDIKISDNTTVDQVSRGPPAAPLHAQSYAVDNDTSTAPADVTIIEPYMTPKHLFVNQIKAYM